MKEFSWKNLFDRLKALQSSFSGRQMKKTEKMKIFVSSLEDCLKEKQIKFGDCSKKKNRSI